MLENPAIRAVPRDKLFSVLKDWELVRLFETILYAAGTSLPTNTEIIAATVDETQGEAQLVHQPAIQSTDYTPDVYQPAMQPWPDGIGYPVGAGGAVAQTTSKATAVTLDKLCGQITMDGALLAASGVVSFTLSSNRITASDTIVCHRKSGGTAGAYQVGVDSVAAGSCVISLRNTTAGALSEAVVLQFSVFKSAIN